MNINIINAPSILIEEGTKAVTLRSMIVLLTVKHIGFFSLFNKNLKFLLFPFYDVFSRLKNPLLNPLLKNKLPCFHEEAHL
jgi:hypothetical protein